MKNPLKALHPCYTILILLAFLPTGRLNAQDFSATKITFEARNYSLFEVFEVVEAQTPYTFAYGNDLENGAIGFSLEGQTTLGEIMEALSAKILLDFRRIGQTIYVKVEKAAKNNLSVVISGKVIDQSGKPIPFALAFLKNTPYGAPANENGFFSIKSVPSGRYSLEISSLGYDSKTLDIVAESDIDLEITLEEDIENLEPVVIYGKSESQELSEAPITITSLGVQKLADLSLGAEQVLKTATGVVVRQSGGLGSDININLNGLTGQAVRIYFDGIPLDVYGGSIQLNNIPVDALNRMDVYKGVMPISIGTDALGGGIDLVPAEKNQEYLRTSYSLGSFNTHRFTLNGNKKISENTSLSLLSFFNYSDNDYNMRDIPNAVELFAPDGSFLGIREETIDTERFHDRHISGFAELALQFKDLGWADRLELATSYSFRDDEIQHGAFIINTAVGEAEHRISGFSHRLDYRKKLLGNKLDLRYYGVLSFTKDKARDSTLAVYDWRGIRLGIGNGNGSELFTIPILRDGENLGTAHRLIAHYEITKNLKATISDFYRYTRVKGEDPAGIRVAIGGEIIDPNTVPSVLSRNIVGAELSYKFWNDKLNTLAFYKNYNYDAESIDIVARSATVLPIRKVGSNESGYGFGVKYQIIPDLFIRGNFEKAVRLPNEKEIFGDFAFIVPNYDIRPERSSNWNVGAQFSKRWSNGKKFLIKVDGFIRDQEELIRPVAFGPQSIRFENEAKVDGKGIEITSRVNPWKNLDLSVNFTHQSNEIASGGVSQGSEASIGNQVPNIPRLFYNIGANYTFDNVFGSPNGLEVFWKYFYTNRFSINDVRDLDNANPTSVVPVQNLHNAGLTYKLINKGVSVSLNIQNVFNSRIFDNFRIPRPGINYALKISYSL